MTGGKRRDRLSEVGAAMRATLTAAAAADPPLTRREWRVLSAVLQLTGTYTRIEDATSHGQITELAALDKPYEREEIGRQLRSLAKRGLIVYQPGESTAASGRINSRVGLRPVDSDPRSTATPGRNGPPATQTGGDTDRGLCRPGVHTTRDRGFTQPETGGSHNPPSEESPEESPEGGPPQDGPRARANANGGGGQADAEGDDSAPDEVAEQFEYLWGVWPKRKGRKRSKGMALQAFRKLTLDQRRRAYTGAINYAAGGEGPMDLHRFLKPDSAGGFHFDDWQTPPPEDDDAAAVKGRDPAHAPVDLDERGIGKGFC